MIGPLPLARVFGRIAIAAFALTLVASCDKNMTPQEEEVLGRGSGPKQGPDPRVGKVFGDDLSVSNIIEGRLFGGEEGRGDGLPVNKYLWQATLDTLQFMPLASTDPFTGVIATDWAGSPSVPNERLKVTAYLTKPELAASSLKVAVFRQVADGNGGWQAAAVSPETALRLENAILTRARQLRVAEIEAG